MDQMKRGKFKAMGDLRAPARFGLGDPPAEAHERLTREGFKYNTSHHPDYATSKHHYTHSDGREALVHERHDLAAGTSKHSIQYSRRTKPPHGKFADATQPPRGTPEHAKNQARLVHYVASNHLHEAAKHHEDAQGHLQAGRVKEAKASWAKAKSAMEAARSAHGELGRHHASFKALEAGLGAMFTECTRPDCHGTNEGRPEPVALDKHMKCPSCGTQYPKDWKGHGDKRAKDLEHVDGTIGDGKFADGASIPKGMDPAHHEVLLKHGYAHTGVGNWGDHHYAHPDGARKATYNSNSKQTMTHGATYGKVTGMAYHKTAAELDEHLGGGYVKGFKAIGPEPMKAPRSRSTGDLKR